MRNNDEVINLIKEITKRKGISLSELARRVNMSKSTISRYFNKTREFPLNYIDNFASALGVSSYELLGIFDRNIENISNFKPLDDFINLFTFKVPHYGTIVMGTPIEEQQEENMFTLLPEFCSKWKNSFTLTAIGESMNKVIPNGSIVQIYPTENYKDGDIVAVCVNGYECTLKRMYKNGNIITLQPDSYDPAFKPQSYNTDDDYPPIKVYGKVVYHLLPKGYEY